MHRLSPSSRRWQFAGLTILFALAAGAWSDASAQSLAEVARQEAARRAAIKSSGRKLTNADLPASAVLQPAAAASPDGETSAKPEESAAGAGNTADGEKPAAAASAAVAAASGAPTAKAPKDDEDGWRARAAVVNKALSDARARTRQLKALSDRLALEMLVSNPDVVARATREREGVKEQLAAAQAAEDEAFAARQALEQEARVSGVPPAWLQ